jgi:transcriptional regulator with XRE-family HTH domain
MPKETRSDPWIPTATIMLSSSAPLDQIQVLPFYHDLRNQLVRPTDVLVSSHYFFRQWKPRLGPVLTLLVLELRDRCYRNKATGKVRNYCWPSQSELARAMGVSVDTIARALKGELAKHFIRVKPRYRYDPIRKKKVRTSSIYYVAMDDPLLPEDEESLRDLLAKEKTGVAADQPSIPQNADQESHRKMPEEEGHEEKTIVNDKEEISEDEKGRREYVAHELARQLEDEKNAACYRVVAAKLPEPLVFETLSVVKDIDRRGKIKKSRGALFVDLIKRKAKERGIDLGFRSAANHLKRGEEK